ncbi:MAG: hypothetical protein MH137_09540 [Flavobacteriales bacterium]|nr:hypothetical protein [Flavobacteriales bacterium]
MNPLWKLNSGEFYGWAHESGALYNANGNHIGNINNSFAFDLNGNYIGELHLNRYIYYNSDNNSIVGISSTQLIDIYAEPLYDIAGTALFDYEDPI